MSIILYFWQLDIMISPELFEILHFWYPEIAFRLQLQVLHFVNHPRTSNKKLQKNMRPNNTFSFEY